MSSGNKHIEDFIPQRPPFVFIDTIDEITDTTAGTRFTIPDTCPLVSDGILPLSGLMENAAQTCAARSGNKIGFIGAVKQMNVTRLPRVGETLTTWAQVIQEVLNICLMEVTTTINNEPIATTTLKIAIME